MLRFRSVLFLTLLLSLHWTASPSAAERITRPIHIQADVLTYSQNKQVYEGKGHVMIVQGPFRMDADEAILNVATSQLTAIGHVHLNDGVRDLSADRLDLNINTKKGVIFHGRLYVLESNVTVDGEVIERLSDTQYRVEEASFTTCGELEGEAIAWRFKAEAAEVDTEGYLFARNVRFCILDIPVLYLPAILFPARVERATGLLFPLLGYSNAQGLKIKQAFFWAINPSQDATVAVDYRGKLGMGGDLEYRYILSRTSEGRLQTHYFRDTQNSVSRFDLLYRHFTKFSDDFQGRIDVNYLNQRNNLNVLSENVIQRVAIFQESQAYLTRRWDNQVLYGLARYSQNLTVSDKTTLQTFPEIGYSLVPARIFGLPVFGSVDTAFDSFYRQEGLDARRADLFPRLWSPLSAGRYFTLTPQVGFRETFYSRRLDSDRSISREVPYASVSLDTRLVRRFSNMGGLGITHKIEPAVVYEYLPPTRQSDLPVFNDLDRLAKKNLLTYMFTNRLSTRVFDGETTQHLEFAYLRISQSQHVTSSPTGKPFSDLRSELILRTLKPFTMTLDIDTFYNHTESAVSSINTDLTMEIQKRYFLGIGQRFTRAGSVPVRGDLFNPLSYNEALVQTETTHFYSAQAGIALPYRFYFVTRGFYDKNDGVFPEINYGLYYVGADRCWGVGALLIQRPGQTEYAFVFTLGGVGSTESPFSAVYRPLFSRLGLDTQKLR